MKNRTDPTWIALVIGIQAILISLVLGWYFDSLADAAASPTDSTLVFYAMLNLALVIALTSATACVLKGHMLVRIALALSTLCFVFLFLSQLHADSVTEDVAALVCWAFLAVALVFIFQRYPIPTTVLAIFVIAIVCQGAATISDLLDDGFLAFNSTILMMLINLICLPIAMVAYEAGFQYFVQSGVRSDGNIGI